MHRIPRKARITLKFPKISIEKIHQKLTAGYRREKSAPYTPHHLIPTQDSPNFHRENPTGRHRRGTGEKKVPRRPRVARITLKFPKISIEKSPPEVIHGVQERKKCPVGPT